MLLWVAKRIENDEALNLSCVRPQPDFNTKGEKIVVKTSLDTTKDSTLVYSTSQLLLSEVMLLLDRN